MLMLLRFTFYSCKPTLIHIRRSLRFSHRAICTQQTLAYPSSLDPYRTAQLAVNIEGTD